MPTVTLSPTKDTWLDPTAGASNYGSSASAQASSDDPSHMMLVAFDLSGIPAGASVSSATLRLRHLSSTSAGASSWAVDRVTADWAEGTVTYNGRPAFSTAERATLSFDSTTVNVWREWNVLGIVNAWRGGQANYGFKVGGGENAGTNRRLTLATREHATATERPELVVVYVADPNPPTNLAPAGDAFVDPTQGGNLNLTWTHNSTTGNPQTAWNTRRRLAGSADAWSTPGFQTSGVSQHSIPYTAFQRGQRYEWQVQTRDAGGDSDWSALAYFWVRGRDGFGDLFI